MQGTCLCKGHVYARDMFMQGTCLCKGHVYARDMFMQGTCLCKGHVYARDMFMQGTCLCKGHVYARDMFMQGTCLCKGHVYARDMFMQGTLTIPAIWSHTRHLISDISASSKPRFARILPKTPFIKKSSGREPHLPKYLTLNNIFLSFITCCNRKYPIPVGI